MAKDATRFVCQACGAVFARWLGRCTSCNAWNTLAEEAAPKGGASSRAKSSAAGAARPLADIPADDLVLRLQTGIGELDRVLGGGAVVGSVTLLGGDPGVGKSTLLMQALGGLAKKGLRSLYVSGEESAGQTAARAKRIGAPEGDLYVLAENDLGVVEAAIADLSPAVLVLDSVQTVRAPDLESAAGTVSQLREVAARIVDKSKRARMTSFLVGHVTKDGSLAGPKVLEHVVDTVLAFEGERGQAFRTLRAQKNRFGSATEIGVFEMTQGGMREVPNPSALFLAERPKNASGSVVCSTSEGSRPMLVEVQALVSRTGGGAGRRTATGTDASRLAMVLAVLERKCGLELSTCDVFVNVAGGLRVDEPAVDLAVALAVASSLRDVPLAPRLVAFGEIGLAGEVRSVPRLEARVAEARAMGFTDLVTPETVKTVAQALAKTGLV